MISLKLIVLISLIIGCECSLPVRTPYMLFNYTVSGSNNCVINDYSSQFTDHTHAKNVVNKPAHHYVSQLSAHFHKRRYYLGDNVEYDINAFTLMLCTAEFVFLKFRLMLQSTLENFPIGAGFVKRIYLRFTGDFDCGGGVVFYEVPAETTKGPAEATADVPIFVAYRTYTRDPYTTEQKQTERGKDIVRAITYSLGGINGSQAVSLHGNFKLLKHRDGAVSHLEFSTNGITIGTSSRESQYLSTGYAEVGIN